LFIYFTKNERIHRLELNRYDEENTTGLVGQAEGPGWWCTHSIWNNGEWLEGGFVLHSEEELTELRGRGVPDPASTPLPLVGGADAPGGPRQLQAGDRFRSRMDKRNRQTERIVLGREEETGWVVYDDATGTELGCRTPDELHAMEAWGFYRDVEYTLARKREKHGRTAEPEPAPEPPDPEALEKALAILGLG
jgi:hypothetical protein